VDGGDVSLQFSLQESEDGDPDLMVFFNLLYWGWCNLDNGSKMICKRRDQASDHPCCVFQLLLWTTLGVMALVVERHLFDCLEVTGCSDLKACGAKELNLLLSMSI
jgi:hypothetical protein